MKLKDLFFHIHYCNQLINNENWKFSDEISRRLDHHELFYVLGGKGYITIENKTYKVKNGMLFYFYPGLYHCIKSDMKTPMNFVSVHFSFVNVLMKNKEWEIKEKNKLINLEAMQLINDYNIIVDIFKKLIETWQKKLPGYEFISQTILRDLLLEIYKYKKIKSSNYATELKIEKIINYMHENIESQITLEELSNIIDMSPTYLSKVFKSITGYSVIEFFNKIKVDKSKTILLKGNKKVKDVARLVGFKDEFYFSRIFKKIEGISPTEFYNKNFHGI